MNKKLMIFKKKVVYFSNWVYYINTCPNGGTGRHTGLKIQRGKTHDGSNPSSGTSKVQALLNSGVFSFS